MSRADVERGEQTWLDAFNRGDAAGVAANYTPEARLMAPNMETVQGRDALEAFCKEFIATGAKLSFDLLTVHESGDLSVAVGSYTMDIPGGPAENGKYIEVWKEQDGGSWKIVDDIFNSSDPVPTA